MSLLPVIAGAVFWAMRKHVVWWEWLAGSAFGFVISVIFHFAAFHGLTSDTETFSGQIEKVVYHPEWVEQYTTTETYTEGKHTRTRVVIRYCTHHEKFEAISNIDSEEEISQELFHDMKMKLGGVINSEWGHKSGFYSGDPNIYVTKNTTGYIYPVAESHTFENRVRATPSLWSFAKVSENAPVFNYPKNEWTKSGRLVGSASSMIDLRLFDQMNARLGPTKKVNVIMVGFPAGTGIELGQMQQSKWIGGKKNDLVITYGGGSTTTNPEWVYCFGWTESELVKQNLQTILLTHPVNNNVLPLIEQEVRANYQLKDWNKFNYLTIEPPGWSYFVFFLVLAAAQTGFWWWANVNEFEKETA